MNYYQFLQEKERNFQRKMKNDKNFSKSFKFVSLTDATIGKELRDAGAIILRRQVSSWYCVSCAIHSHKVHIRSADDRRNRDKIR
ncbi:MAG: hypothetical protein ACTSYI_01900 [Promethearchaeota archaeon]